MTVRSCKTIVYLGGPAPWLNNQEFYHLFHHEEAQNDEKSLKLRSFDLHSLAGFIRPLNFALCRSLLSFAVSFATFFVDSFRSSLSPLGTCTLASPENPQGKWRSCNYVTNRIFVSKRECKWQSLLVFLVLCLLTKIPCTWSWLALSIICWPLSAASGERTAFVTVHPINNLSLQKATAAVAALSSNAIPTLTEVHTTQKTPPNLSYFLSKTNWKSTRILLVKGRSS